MENKEIKKKPRKRMGVWGEIRVFLDDRFSLDEDKATQDQIAAAISKGTEFRGVNLWVLIFATMIASAGT